MLNCWALNQTVALECAQCKKNVTDTPYEKRLQAAARADFRKFWSDYRWWATIVGIFNLPIIVQLIHGENTMINWGLASIYALISLVISLLGSYAIAMRRGAEVLDSDLQSKLAKSDASIQELTTKLKEVERDPAEEYHYVKTQAILGKASDTQKATLMHIWTHQKLFAGEGIARLGKELNLDTRLIINAIAELSVTQLIEQHWSMIGNQKEIWWEITPGYRTAIGKLLYK
jgi:hypothetical protein